MKTCTEHGRTVHGHSQNANPRSILPPLVLTLIVMLAAVLRLTALDFGLPNIYHPDEDLLVIPAMTILKTGDWQPIRMDYGGLFIYTLVLVYVPVFLFAARTGAITRVDELVMIERGVYPSLYPHPEYILAGRLVSAVLGIGLVLLVYLLGRRLGGPGVGHPSVGGTRLGLIAAALAAVLPDLVVNAHYATTDTATTFMILLALYLLVRAYDHWEQDTMWAYVGAGFVCGLAVSTKYNAAFIAVALLLVPLLKVRSLDEWLRARVLLGPFAMALGFLVSTPYALLDLPEFTYWTGNALRLYNRPFNQLVLPTWLWELEYLLTGRNALIVVSGLIGFFLSLIRWGKRGWIVNAFGLIFLWSIFTQDARAARTWLPVAPLFVLWAALAWEVLLTWLPGKLRTRRWGKVITSATLGLTLLLLLWLSATAVGNLAADDVRTVTQQWIEQNVPPGTTLSFDRFPANIDPAVWPTANVFGHYQNDLAWYQENGVDYVFVGDVIHNPEQLSAEDTARYQALLVQLCPVETLTGSILAVAERHIRVYQIPPCSE